MSEDRYFVGLDLGQKKDFTAIVALQRSKLPVPHPSGRHRYKYEVRAACRWPLNTPYTTIATEVVNLVSKPPLAGCMLGIDKTGVGAGVVEIIRAAKPDAWIRPIIITGGFTVTEDKDDRGYHVPKMELVAVVNALLDDDQLDIPDTIKLAPILGSELRTFRGKVTPAGNETAAADWRTQAHDDLVFALAIPAWLGSLSESYDWHYDEAEDEKYRSVIESAPRGVFLTRWDDDDD
jgi:hypothetical protein